MNIEIANRLVQLRRQNNLSQEELAEKIGISRQAVSKWERAEASPDIDNLIMLSKLYHISLDDLLKTEDDCSGCSASEPSCPEAQCAPPDQDAPHCEPPQAPAGYAQQPEQPTYYDSQYQQSQQQYDGGQQPMDSGYYPQQEYYPVYDPMQEKERAAARKKRMLAFPYPVLVTAVFLLLGFFFNLWHPGWLLFLTIPFYYCYAESNDLK